MTLAGGRVPATPADRRAIASLLLSSVFFAQCSVRSAGGTGAGSAANGGGGGPPTAAVAGAAATTTAAGGFTGASGRGGTNAAGGVAGRGGAGSGGLAATTGGAGSGTAGAGLAGGIAAGTLALRSTTVPTNGAFPEANTCSGADTSPDLEWTPGPSQTESYAVTLTDSATGKTLWVVWDIPASVTSLPAGLDASPALASPAGAKQVSSNGNGYAGPCPSGAQGFYLFTIFALPVATLAGVSTLTPPDEVVTALNLSTPLELAFFGASATASDGGG